MSALLIDDLRINESESGEPVFLQYCTDVEGASLATVTPLPVAPRVQSASGWRLTDRGIAVVLTAFVGLFLTGVVVAVTSFLSVSDAPLGDEHADVAAVSVLR